MRRLRVYAIVCCALSLLRAVDAYGRPSRCVASCDVSATTAANGTSTTKLRNEMIGGGGRAGSNGRLVADEGRGKKKKKTKNASTNMMVGGSVMAGFVVIIVFLNVITVTLGKALLFTFITKFLVSVNWMSSGSSSSEKKSDRKDVTVVVD